MFIVKGLKSPQYKIFNRKRYNSWNSEYKILIPITEKHFMVYMDID